MLTALLSAGDARAAGTEPAGRWLVTLDTPDVGTILVPMWFESTGEGRFLARSRENALGRTVGPGRALLGRLLAHGAYERGALLQLADGEVVDADGVVTVRGRLRTPMVGATTLDATWDGDHLTGTLRRRDGSAWAGFDAVLAADEVPVRDYGAVWEDAKGVVATRIFDPSIRDDGAWRRFERRLDRRLPESRDDAEALLHFYGAAGRLGLSHLALVGDGFGEQGPVEDDEPESATTLTFPASEVAHLTIRHFAGDATAIHRAFEEIDAAKARALILDLRGNAGGNLSSMAVAAHLVEVETPAGVFVGASWWRSNDALPSPERLAEIPPLSSYEVDDFFAQLAERGLVVGRVRPEAPRFEGRVLVLVDARTASAAEPLVHLLSASGRATVIGERTAGAMLSSEPVPLRSGMVLVLPTADYLTAEGARLEGAGVPPDLRVDPEVALDEALAIIAGRPALSARP